MPNRIRRALRNAALLSFASTIAFAGSQDGELMRANFDDNSLAGWTVVDEGHIAGPSNWSASDGEVRQLSNIWGGEPTGNNWTGPGSYLRYDAGTKWRDYSAEMRVRSDDDDALGVMFRVDRGNYYRFSWDASRAVRRLVRHVDGKYALLAEDYASYERGHEYTVTVRANGTSLRVFIDGQTIFDVQDDSVANGTIALYTWANRPTVFDDVTVVVAGKDPAVLSTQDAASDDTPPAVNVLLQTSQEVPDNGIADIREFAPMGYKRDTPWPDRPPRVAPMSKMREISVWSGGWVLHHRHTPRAMRGRLRVSTAPMDSKNVDWVLRSSTPVTQVITFARPETW